MSEIALEVRGLTRTFGTRAAVSGLDLTVQAGDIYGFLGPNGAGKTTAMRCILGLIRRDKGEVKIFGDADPVRSRRHIGAIIEVPSFHGWLSGRDNLRHSAAYLGLSPREAEPEIDRVLQRVDLTERARDLAAGYSLGMKQRLGIARALLGRPKLLLLDEPTNGLDPKGMREIREFVKNLATVDGITVFISSHLLGEVQQMCNRVGIINGGVLRREGDVADIIAANSGPLQLVLIGSSDRPALRAALGAFPQVKLIGETDNERLRVGLPPEGPSVAELNRALVQAGVNVDHLAVETRTLEDVFLEATA
jgi:ABC-type multidrug transport system ATPase subunit